MWKLLVLFFVVAAHAGYYEELMAKQVPEIMKKNPTWVAGYNPYLTGKSQAQLRQLLGGKVDKNAKVPQFTPIAPAIIPATFDARSQWPKCPSIEFIRDQGQCGSSWAVAPAEVMTDRTCIVSNAQLQPYISDDNILACCNDCGSVSGGDYPCNAFQFWCNCGVVTGGPYNSHQGCQPTCYNQQPTGWPGNTNTPKCKNTCEAGYNVSYSDDKHYGSTYYQISGGVTSMQTDLMNNGPIATVFDVYEDFYSYTTGIYKHVVGEYEGGHVVKIFGWGEDNGEAYWLVANSWNVTWGMGGFFKMIRGVNDCDFETCIYAGLAKS